MKLKTLKPLKNNPRKISDSAMKRLEESISRDPEYMIARPIIIDQNNTIIGGNQRYKACKNLGMDEVPDSWVKRVEWDKDKTRRFSLVDNAPEGMSGDWDMELLEDEFSTFELEELGFEAADSDFAVVDDSLGLDTRTNRNKPSRNVMVISVGKMSGLVEYDLCSRVQNKVERCFGDMPKFAEWLDENISNN